MGSVDNNQGATLRQRLLTLELAPAPEKLDVAASHDNYYL